MSDGMPSNPPRFLVANTHPREIQPRECCRPGTRQRVRNIALDKLRAIAVIDTLDRLGRFSSWNSPRHTQCATHQTSRREDVWRPRSHQRRPTTRCPFDVEKIRLTERCMAVVFLKGGLLPIPIANGEHLFHPGRRRGVCQFAHCRMQRPANLKRNSLPNLNFLRSRNTVRLKDNQKQLPKTNNYDCQQLPKTDNGTH